MSNWIKIERDSSGLATEKCLLHITNNLPVIITDVYKGEITDIDVVLNDEYACDWLNDIKIKSTRHTHYMPITLPQL